ncbi:hypothetical protein GMRT_12610 [Giardia muris]|uniref:Uncharacterized protein n=1 Tax=Giardia muris TaxID=5742 RepID=A0A4Z1SY93_GIAMU|nr:hypothetical protein GMRT_12610 [Giardia muris]|eukprot:TNJ28478.1 hypothetical protein GMRT_12610 [Giardia muris]
MTSPEPRVACLSVMVGDEPVVLVFKSLAAALKLKKALRNSCPEYSLARGIEDEAMRRYARKVAGKLVQRPLFVDACLTPGDWRISLTDQTKLSLPLASAEAQSIDKILQGQRQAMEVMRRDYDAYHSVQIREPTRKIIATNRGYGPHPPVHPNSLHGRPQYATPYLAPHARGQAASVFTPTHQPGVVPNLPGTGPLVSYGMPIPSGGVGIPALQPNQAIPTALQAVSLSLQTGASQMPPDPATGERQNRSLHTLLQGSVQEKNELLQRLRQELSQLPEGQQAEGLLAVLLELLAKNTASGTESTVPGVTVSPVISSPVPIPSTCLVNDQVSSIPQKEQRPRYYRQTMKTEDSNIISVGQNIHSKANLRDAERQHQLFGILVQQWWSCHSRAIKRRDTIQETLAGHVESEAVNWIMGNLTFKHEPLYSRPWQPQEDEYLAFSVCDQVMCFLKCSRGLVDWGHRKAELRAALEKALADIPRTSGLSNGNAEMASKNSSFTNPDGLTSKTTSMKPLQTIGAPTYPYLHSQPHTENLGTVPQAPLGLFSMQVHLQKPGAQTHVPTYSRSLSPVSSQAHPRPGVQEQGYMPMISFDAAPGLYPGMVSSYHRLHSYTPYSQQPGFAPYPQQSKVPHHSGSESPVHPDRYQSGKGNRNGNGHLTDMIMSYFSQLSPIPEVQQIVSNILQTSQSGGPSLPINLSAHGGAGNDIPPGQWQRIINGLPGYINSKMGQTLQTVEPASLPLEKKTADSLCPDETLVPTPVGLNIAIPEDEREASFCLLVLLLAAGAKLCDSNPDVIDYELLRKNCFTRTKIETLRMMYSAIYRELVNEYRHTGYPELQGDNGCVICEPVDFAKPNKQYDLQTIINAYRDAVAAANRQFLSHEHMDRATLQRDLQGVSALVLDFERIRMILFGDHPVPPELDQAVREISFCYGKYTRADILKR